MFDIKILAVVVVVPEENHASGILLLIRDVVGLPGHIILLTCGPHVSRFGRSESGAENKKFNRLDGCSTDKGGSSQDEGGKDSGERAEHDEYNSSREKTMVVW